MESVFCIGMTAALIVRRARALASFAPACKLPSALLQSQKDCQHATKIVFSVGNQAGDLDTIVSAIGIAYLKNNTKASYSSENNNSTSVTLPLIPFPRSEFRLRRDAVFLFKMLGFDMENMTESPSELIFIDELVNYPNTSTYYDLILTDHNSCTLEHLKLQYAHVVEIIDHHTDSGDHPKVQGVNRNVVSGLGSACTLVAESLLAAEDQGICEIPPDLSILLMTTIELDSRKWNPARSGPRDRAAYNALRHRIQNTPFDLDNMYTLSTRARQDVSSLSFDDLLKLDYKKCTSSPNGIKCGIASIMRTYSKLCKQGNDSRASGGSGGGGSALSSTSSSTSSNTSSNTSSSSSNSGLVSSMQKFAREKGDLDVVFGFTAKEQSITMSSNMGVKHLIIYDAKSEDGTLSRSFVDFLNRVPDCLSSSLRNDPIMIKQKVLERGVTVAETTQININARTIVVQIEGLVSRKALKPITEEWMDSL
jgi:inorganic pyrophosphatase/exopolyphosphatase